MAEWPRLAGAGWRPLSPGCEHQASWSGCLRRGPLPRDCRTAARCAAHCSPCCGCSAPSCRPAGALDLDAAQLGGVAVPPQRNVHVHHRVLPAGLYCTVNMLTNRRGARPAEQPASGQRQRPRRRASKRTGWAGPGAACRRRRASWPARPRPQAWSRPDPWLLVCRWVPCVGGGGGRWRRRRRAIHMFPPPSAPSRVADDAVVAIAALGWRGDGLFCSRAAPSPTISRWRAPMPHLVC